MFFSLSLSEMMLKVGFNKHYLVIAMLFCALLAKAQTPPSFTSNAITNGTYGTAYVYSITTEDESSARIISYSGALPNGLTFADAGDGTATISGTLNETGSFPIVLTVDDQTDGTDTQSFTLVIAKASATITLSNLSLVYNGSAQPATAVTSPVGLTVDITYNSLATVPTNAGSYSVAATINDANYEGTATGTLVISKAPATITLSALSKIYNGTGHSATATTAPAGLTVNTTYDGAAALPVNTGSYTVASTINEPNYEGTASGTLVIGKATASVTLSALSKTYNGSAQPPTITTVPAGLTVSTTYDGVATLPVNAGSYVVVSTVNDSNYEGNTSGTLVIGKAAASVALSGLSKTYTGSNQSATVTTTPAGLAVSTTYNGAATLPVNANSYAVVSTINDANYTGSANGTLVIGKATASVTLTDLSKTYTGSGQSATVTTTPAGLTVITTYNGSASLPVNANSYTVAATINDVNYTGSTSGTLVIGKATATASLSGLSKTYNGSAQPATITTIPAGLTVTTTYNGAAASPVNVNSYAVVSTINDANYTGSTSGTLTISKATATITLGALTKTFNGSAQPVTATTSPAGLTVITTYDGSTSPPVNAGSYTVVASIDESNYQGTASGTLIINKATPTVTWTNPAAITYGTPLSATQLSATASVPGTFSYAPGLGNILNAGVNQLSVNFTPNDALNYNSVNGIQRPITINKATPVITWSDPLPIRINVALSSTQLNATSTVPGTFVYSPSSGSSFSTDGVKTLSVSFTPSDANNYNSVPNTQVQISVSNKDNPVITWPAPAAISYGTLLSATQLNASANVPGSFTYTPNIGTLLTAGSNKNLKVDFTPNDAVNYNTISKTVQITVNPAVLTATASSASRVYGAANPSFSITYSGFVNNENGSVLDTPPAVTCQAIPTDNAGGVYPVTVSGGVDDNYSFNYVNGTLTITKATVTVHPDNKLKSYGQDNPAFTVTYTGLVNGNPESVIDSPPIATTNATKLSAAGTYPITASGGADNNYNFSFTPGVLTINKVTLAVKANDISQTYGTLPVPTISYAGFVNAETAAVLDARPAAATSATSTSGIGTYPITVSGGSDNNYDFTYTNGELTINKAILTVTVNSVTRLFNTENPPLTVNYTGFVNNENINVIDILPTIFTTATSASSGGSYPITVSGGADDAYDFAYVNGTLTVVVNNPPVLKNFQVNTNEDVPLTFTYDMFNQNITDDAGSQIAFIKIASLPAYGTLLVKGVKAVVNSEVAATNNSLADFVYQPNTDYNGTDSFIWSSSDGTFSSTNQATVLIRINAVNDAPVLSNIESESIKYSLGDKAVPITQKLTVNDVDNNFIHSAKITITQNYSTGDNLAASSSLSTKITAAFNTATRELTLKGKDTKSNYEAALSGIVFSSAVTGDATVSTKTMQILVNDSTSNSNIVSRNIEITEVFPELNIVNSFTPNGDGINDQWDIVNLDLYSKIKITIVNQEGVNVFSCASQDCKWDGTFKGGQLPAGAYFYTIDLNDGKRKYQGTVTILK